MTRVPPGFPDRREIERTFAEAKTLGVRFLQTRCGLLCRIIGNTALVSAIAGVLIFGWRPVGQIAFHATLTMERVSALLADTKTIPPNAAQEISRLLRNPANDCKHVACSAAVAKRNRIARAELATILARASAPDAIANRLLGITQVREQSR